MATIRDLDAEDVASIPAVSGGPAWSGGTSKWSRYWEQHVGDARTCLVAQDESGNVGYVSIVWSSQHEPFRRSTIPEIQDLVVAEFGRGPPREVRACPDARSDLGQIHWWFARKPQGYAS